MTTLDAAFCEGRTYAFSKNAGIGSLAKKVWQNKGNAARAVWNNRFAALPIAGATLGATMRPADDPWERLLFGSLGGLAGGGLALKLVQKKTIADAARKVLGKSGLNAARRRDAIGSAALLGGALGGTGYSVAKLINRGQNWMDTTGKDILTQGAKGAGVGALAGGLGGYAIGNNPHSILYGAALGGGLGFGGGVASHSAVRDAGRLLRKLGAAEEPAPRSAPKSTGALDTYRRKIHPLLRRAAGAGLGGYLGYTGGEALGNVLELDPTRSRIVGGGAGTVIGGALPEIPGLLAGSAFGGMLGTGAGRTIGRGIGDLISRVSDSDKDEARETGAVAGKVVGGLGGMIGGAYLGRKLFGNWEPQT